MKFDPKIVRWVLWGAGALDIVWIAVRAMLEGGTAITFQGVLMAAGPALLAYATRAPGHLTEDQADALANKRADQAVRASKAPPR